MHGVFVCTVYCVGLAHECADAHTQGVMLVTGKRSSTELYPQPVNKLVLLEKHAKKILFLNRVLYVY